MVSFREQRLTVSVTACPQTPNLLSAGGQGFQTCWGTHRTQEAEETLGTGCGSGNVFSLHRLLPQPFTPALLCLESSSPDPCMALLILLISGQRYIPRQAFPPSMSPGPLPLSPSPPFHSPLPLSHHDPQEPGIISEQQDDIRDPSVTWSHAHCNWAQSPRR